MVNADNYEVDDFFDYSNFINGFEDIGCCFPISCLMPGDHPKSECHTVEMLEAYLNLYQSEVTQED